MATAAGLASCGKIVFVSTFAIFATGRAWDQVRNSICYNNFNVKIVASHAGITVGEDGASHQAIEDIAVMRCIPNMTIIVPCDGPETREAVLASVEKEGPVYIRLGRAKFPTIENKKKFEIGKAYPLCEGKDLTIVACGIMVHIALAAAEELRKEKINVTLLNVHTIKPLDKETLLEYARLTQRFIVCEEHMVTGGLGSAVAEFLSEVYPVPVCRIGISDHFGQSGSPEELLKKYGLTARDIVEKAKVLVKK
ncbi:MAG: transketolase family protein, partial [Candidatus Omnitrophica bacterium]|nr:transketolase family protein [Candidatus Omnitrophota bacterium]